MKNSWLLWTVAAWR